MIESYTVTEVAEMLKLSRKTVERYVREGIIPAVKFGNTYRVTKEKLYEFLANHSTKSTK